MFLLQSEMGPDNLQLKVTNCKVTKEREIQVISHANSFKSLAV